MTPLDLIGLPYRLGADFARHGAGDCLSLARTVLGFYGIATPQPQRAWYRRLRRGDTAVFRDELKRWGLPTDTPRLGTAALCQVNDGFGLAVYAEGGWLSYVGLEVAWSPVGALLVVECYFPQKQSYATRSG